MKQRILFLMMTALLSVGAWAAKDLTLNPAETVAFGDWGFDNSAEPTLKFTLWSAGGGWQFDTALSQDDYCGVDIAFEATTETRVYFFIGYEGGTEQSIEVPTGSTSIKADFAYTGGITKIGFKYSDWAAENGAVCSITITSAVVKANSTGEVVELSFDDLQENNVPATKDASDNSFSLTRYSSYAGWYFNNINSNDYEKVVITFSEAIPEDGIQLNATGAGDDWPGTKIAGLTKGATKVTVYFSAKPDVTISSVGFYYGWNSKQDTEEDGPTTLKIASAKLYKKTEFVRTITDALYATTSFPAAVDFSQTDGIKAYIAKANVAEAEVELTEVNKVAAGVPVILNGSAKDYTLHYTTESTDDVSDNNLHVSDGTVTGDGTIYVLAKKNIEDKDVVGFFKLQNDDKVPAGKAYLQISSGGAVMAPAFFGFGFGDGTTGIDNLTPALSKDEKVYYDLQGRRVAQPTKGLYIVNGKKVIIK